MKLFNHKPVIKLRDLLRSSGIGGFVCLIVLVLIFSIISPNFFKISNINNVLDQTVILGILTIGQTFVIITGNIDISIGSILAMSSMIMADMAKNFGLNPFITISIGLLVGMGLGLINGLLVAKLKLNSLISTLATYSVLKGLAWLYNGGQPIYPLPDSFRWLGSVKIGGIFQVNIIYLIILVIIFQFVLGKTQFGRYIYGIGGNKRAASILGIKVERIIIYCYIVSGTMAAFGGAILSGKLSTGSSEFGEPYLLTAIAAAVLGGASLFGGEGSVLSSVFAGALVVTIIGNGLNLLLVPIAWQKIVIGVVLTIAVLIDAQRHKKVSGS